MKKVLLTAFLIVTMCSSGLWARTFAFSYISVTPNGDTLCFLGTLGEMAIDPSSPSGLYTIHGGGLILTGVFHHDSVRGHVEVPETVTVGNETMGYVTNPVVAIGEYAFQNCSGMTSISLPSTIEYIYNNAFQGCNHLRHINLPDSLRGIGDEAFSDCWQLVLTIPQHTHLIRGDALYGVRTFYYNGDATGAPCGAERRSGYVENGIYYTSSAKNTLMYGEYTLTSATIPASVNRIFPSAFAFCHNLTTVNYNAVNARRGMDDDYYYYDDDDYESYVTPFYGWDDSGDSAIMAPVTTLNIAEGVLKIPGGLMRNIATLTTVNFPSSLKYIGGYAFAGSGLTSLTIPASVDSIARNAFACPNLTTVVYNARRAKTGFDEGDLGYNGSDNRIFLSTNVGWNENGDTAYITSLTIGDEVEYIPDYFLMGDTALTSLTMSSSVKYIGKNAFTGAGITSLTIPASVDSIGNAAFVCPNLTMVNYNAVNAKGYVTPFYAWDYNGDSAIMAPVTTMNIAEGVLKIPGGLMWNIATLTTVNFPSSLTYIGGHAFAGSGLTSLTIPASVDSIARNAFACPNLTTVVYNARRAKTGFDEGDLEYDGSDNRIFLSTNGGWNENGDTAYITSLTIGDEVEYVPDYFLMGDTALTSLTMSSSVKYIGKNAFTGAGITTVNLPSSLKYIGGHAFAGSGLTSLTIPASVDSIARNAFACPNLTTVVYNARRAKTGFDEGDLEYDGSDNRIFLSTNVGWNRTGDTAYITSLTIGDEVEYVPDYFLLGDTALTAVTIPPSVKNIGSYAFNGTSITSITIPATLDTLGDNVFNTNGTLTNVTYLPANLHTSSGSFGFYSDYSDYYENITQNLTIGSGVRHIPDDIFSGMHITSVTLPDSLLTIGNNAFAGTMLNEVIIPDMVTTIGLAAFFDYNAFDYGLTGTLRRVTIGESVNSIGSYAFVGMTNPDTIFVLAEVPPTITSTTFEGMPTNAKIRVPCGTKEDYEDASFWNNFTRISEDPSCYMLITAVPNNAAYGSVTGGGRYSVGNIATLSAMPHNGHAFTGWADGSSDNPRLVLVMGDASYTANFAPATMQPVHDTTIVTVTDTVTEYVTVYDTTVVTQTDTVVNTVTEYVHDTTLVFDTVTLTEYVTVHDTTIVTLSDTIVNTVYDTVDNYIYDTIVNTVYDTVTNTLYDTITNIVYDTVTNTVYDTVTNTVYDTTVVDNYIYDTTIVTDTLWLTQYDTVWMTDTIYIHDTVYVTQEGIDDVQTANIRLYQRNGQIVVEDVDGGVLPEVMVYDAVGRRVDMSLAGSSSQPSGMAVSVPVPASGVYLVKVGDRPARRIVVIR